MGEPFADSRCMLRVSSCARPLLLAYGPDKTSRGNFLRPLWRESGCHSRSSSLCHRIHHPAGAYPLAGGLDGNDVVVLLFLCTGRTTSCWATRKKIWHIGSGLLGWDELIAGFGAGDHGAVAEDTV